MLPAVRQVSIERTEIFSGPIPAPAACAQYEQVLPGFTDRALAMAEKAQQSDIAARNKGINFTLIWRMSGLVMAFLLAVLIVGGGIFLLYLGKNIEGYSLLVSAGVGIVLAIRSGKGKAE